MKNIHVLPTDKPSRLYLNGFQRLVLDDKIEIADDNSFTNQHIYITNSEEIKDAKWIIHNGKIHEVTKNKGLYISVKKVSHIDIRADLCKKIIITDNEDLIKDGVQAIDDEFLEWFVKNPSCENVKVEEEKKAFDNEHREIPFALDKDDYVKKIYKIIIPKEEPEQETVGRQFHKTADMVISVIRDKETPKEAAKSKYGIGYGAVDSINAFIEGTKWQSERMYSEEDMREAFKGGGRISWGDIDDFNEWFEQFKKK